MVAGVRGGLEKVVGPDPKSTNNRISPPKTKETDNRKTGVNLADVPKVDSAVPHYTSLTSPEQLDQAINGIELTKAQKKKITKAMKALGYQEGKQWEDGEFLNFHLAVSRKPSEEDPDNVEIYLTADLGKNATKAIDKHGFGYFVYGWIGNLFSPIDRRMGAKFSNNFIEPQDDSNTKLSPSPDLKGYRRGVNEGRYTTSIRFDLSDNSETGLKGQAMQIFDNMKSQIDQMRQVVAEMPEDDPMRSLVEAQLKQALKEGMDRVTIAGPIWTNAAVAEKFQGASSEALFHRQELMASFIETMDPMTTVISPIHIFAPEDAKTRNHIYEGCELMTAEKVDGKLQEHKCHASIIRHPSQAEKPIAVEHIAQFFAAHMMLDAGARGPESMDPEMQKTFMNLVQKNIANLKEFNQRVEPEKEDADKDTADKTAEAN